MMFLKLLIVFGAYCFTIKHAGIVNELSVDCLSHGTLRVLILRILRGLKGIKHRLDDMISMLVGH